MEMNITIVIILITCGISIWAFNNREVMGKLIFDPIAVTKNNQYYRFLSSGFVHADFMHLIFNMITLYSFGPIIERSFNSIEVFGQYGNLMYVLLYLTAIVVSEIPAYFKNKNNSGYLSLGASGATSAVIFAAVLFYPTLRLSMMFIPIPMPAYIFCIVFVVVSSMLDRFYPTNINHSAHIFGGLYGLAFTVLMVNLLGKYNIIEQFLFEIRGQ